MSTWNLQKRITIVTSVAQLNALEASIAKAEYLAVDCETTGLDRFTKAVGIGLAWSEDDAAYVPLSVFIPGTGLVDPWEPEAKLQVAEFIRRQLTLSNRLLGHNVSFDAKAIANTLGFDIIPYVFADTQLLHHTAVSEEPSHKLKDLARKYLEDAADSPQLDLKESVLANGGQWLTDAKDMFMGDYQILGKYCAYDVLYTFGLFNRFYPKLAEQKLTKLWSEEVMPLLKVTHSLNTTGVAINVDHFKKLAVEIGANIKNIEAAIFAEIGDKVADYEYGKILETTKITPKSQLGKHLLALGWDGSEASIPDFKFLIKAWYRNKNGDAPIFNLDSNNDKAYLLYDVLGFACAKMTKSGKRSVTKKDLEELEKEHGDNPIINMLSKRSKETKILTTYVEPILEKSIDGRIYPSFNQTGTTSGRYSSNNPNCLSLDTQVLTDSGFKYYCEITPDTKIACYSLLNGGVEWHSYLRKYVSPVQEHTMVKCKNQHMDWSLTDNHRCLFRDRKSKEFTVKPASKFLRDSSILHGAVCVNQGTCSLSDDMLQFLVATQADAEITKYDSIRFVFTKERKYIRLKNILRSLGWEYLDKAKPGRYEVVIKGKNEQVTSILSVDKALPAEWVGSLSYGQRDIVINEMFEWDGLSTRKNNFSSSIEHNVDVVQALCSLHGWRAHKRVYYSKPGANPNYQLDITRRDHSNTANASISLESTINQVWCVEVPTQYFIARRGSYTFITGNCQNIPRDDLRIKSGMIPDPGYVFVNADYSSLEPRCFAEMSGEPELKRVYAEGLDLYSHVYITLFNAKEYSAKEGDDNFLKAKNKAARQGAKEYTLGFAYGMSEYKLAKILGISLEEALAYKNKYFEAFPRLLNYQKSCKLSMYKNGYISNLLGRRRRGTLLNILFRIGVPLDNKWKLRGAYEKFKMRYFAEYETVEKFLGAVSNEINNSYNFPIQSLAAAIVNAACIKFTAMAEQLQLDARIMLQVHDEITILCHGSIADKVAKLLKECMENNSVTSLLSVPMQAEPLITDKSLAEAK